MFAAGEIVKINMKRKAEYHNLQAKVLLVGKQGVKVSIARPGKQEPEIRGFAHHYIEKVKAPGASSANASSASSSAEPASASTAPAITSGSLATSTEISKQNMLKIFGKSKADADDDSD